MTNCVTSSRLTVAAAAIAVVGMCAVAAQAQGQAGAAPPPKLGPAKPAAGGATGNAARGKYLVTVIDCGGCHTPLKMGPNGPEPDETRMLSGHPATIKLPPPPAPAGAWGGFFPLEGHRVRRPVGRELSRQSHA